MVMCLGGYAGKNMNYSVETSTLLGGDASGANQCYLVAHHLKTMKKGFEDPTPKIVFEREKS